MSPRRNWGHVSCNVFLNFPPVDNSKTALKSRLQALRVCVSVWMCEAPSGGRLLAEGSLAPINVASLGSLGSWEMCLPGSMSKRWQPVTDWLLLKQSTTTETVERRRQQICLSTCVCGGVNANKRKKWVNDENPEKQMPDELPQKLVEKLWSALTVCSREALTFLFFRINQVLQLLAWGHVLIWLQMSLTCVFSKGKTEDLSMSCPMMPVWAVLQLNRRRVSTIATEINQCVLPVSQETSPADQNDLMRENE